MRKLKRWGRGIITVMMATTMVVFYPGVAAVGADEANPTTVPASTSSTEPTTNTQPTTAETPSTPAPETTSNPKPPVESSPGPSKPNGVEANTYTYNPNTGLWENDYYTWDPVSRTTTPKTPQEYTYNPASNAWEPTPSQAALSTSTNGPSSGSSVDGDAENELILNGSLSADLKNTLDSQATTGNALAANNTTVGNLLSGNASSMANIINLLQSSASFADNGNLVTFNKDIQGSVTGDLLINPSELASLSATASMSPVNKLTVNNQSSGVIDNQLSLGAVSGGASADSNTTIGNVQTGDANAVANVVNAINSAIAAKQSFLGAVNIYGSLNGDILLPPGFLDSLVASNTQAMDATSSTTVNNTTNQAINNNVHTTASTGNAVASTNTTVGNVGSGDALNNLTILNLTGNDIVAANNLLVFVNVLGKWYGVIMNAPSGTTAASVAGGVANHTLAGSATDAELNNQTDNTINNDLSLSAKSGNASATNNTTVGDVKTGNATTSVNLANLINSHLSLSDWFGILFINVFGEWNGSFGVNTSAGDPAPAPTTGNTNTGSGNQPSVQVFRFVPRTSSTTGDESLALESATTAGASSAEDTSTPVVLGSTGNTSTPASPSGSASAKWLIPSIGLLIGAVLLGIERLLSRRDNRTTGGTAVKPATA